MQILHSLLPRDYYVKFDFIANFIFLGIFIEMIIKFIEAIGAIKLVKAIRLLRLKANNASLGCGLNQLRSQATRRLRADQKAWAGQVQRGV